MAVAGKTKERTARKAPQKAPAQARKKATKSALAATRTGTKPPPKARKAPARPADDAWMSGLAAPARRALAGAGITTLAQLAKWREADVTVLHGMGPNALARLRAMLAGVGLAFAP